MDRRSHRVVDDDRLAGLWLRHTSSDYTFHAPVRLPDETFGLVHVELHTAGSYARNVIRWTLFSRSGVVDSGELDMPAVAFWQALAHVERLLIERGIRLNGNEQGKG